MDKPISQVNKIIIEEDKVYQLYVNVSIQQMSLLSSLVYETILENSLLTGVTSNIQFTEIATVQLPLTITLKKNPDTMEGLIEESITFNTRHDWQKEIPYENG